MKRQSQLARTGFRRAFYSPPPVPPLRPLERCGSYGPAEVLAMPKFQYLRSRSYREWVAGHPCFACGISGHSQAAHPNAAKYGKGGRIKASDEFCFPLCTVRPGHMGCHEMHDLLIDTDRGEAEAAEAVYIERMQARAVRDGWRFGPEGITRA